MLQINEPLEVSILTGRMSFHGVERAHTAVFLETNATRPPEILSGRFRRSRQQAAHHHWRSNSESLISYNRGHCISYVSAGSCSEMDRRSYFVPLQKYCAFIYASSYHILHALLRIIFELAILWITASSGLYLGWSIEWKRRTAGSAEGQRLGDIADIANAAIGNDGNSAGAGVLGDLVHRRALSASHRHDYNQISS